MTRARLTVLAPWALVAASLLAIATQTMPGLSTAHGASGLTNWTPGAGIASSLDNVNRSWGLLNVVGNVLLFGPLGFSLVLVKALRARWAVLACVAVSAMIEGVQLLSGRSLDVDDVLLNAAGGALGAVVALGLLGLVKRSAYLRRAPSTASAD